jgi:hypothetical protein
LRRVVARVGNGSQNKGWLTAKKLSHPRVA